MLLMDIKSRIPVWQWVRTQEGDSSSKGNPMEVSLSQPYVESQESSSSVCIRANSCWIYQRPKTLHLELPQCSSWCHIASDPDRGRNEGWNWSAHPSRYDASLHPFRGSFIILQAPATISPEPGRLNWMPLIPDGFSQIGDGEYYTDSLSRPCMGYVWCQGCPLWPEGWVDQPVTLYSLVHLASLVSDPTKPLHGTAAGS